jgi:hypothetical protein
MRVRPERQEDLSVRQEDLSVRLEDLSMRLKDLSVRLEDLSARQEDSSVFFALSLASHVHSREKLNKTWLAYLMLRILSCLNALIPVFVR